ncbi:tweedleX [Haematobia irritans]|uniref:tweedleX n=1 Tax=Haematobia irritans TaxID=7368 RepID=UPI003F4FEE73
MFEENMDVECDDWIKVQLISKKGYVNSEQLQKGYGNLILVCASVLLSCVNARPDLSLGYRYNQGHSSGGGAFLNAPVGNSYNPTASGNGYYASRPSVGQYSNFATGGNQGFSQGGSGSFGGFDSGSFGSSGSVGGSGSFSSIATPQFNSGSNFPQTSSNHVVDTDEQQAFLSHLRQHQAPIVTKHFYLHSAPVDHDEQQIVRYVNIGRPQKNYRVVFIDTPSSNTNKAKIIANVAPTEEKTAIYVLSKKKNALDVSAEVVTPAPVNNKPEVFFIKYKTPEEAVHAQHTIQAQYDALGGSSDVSNEGPIPVSSVIGSLGGSTDDDSTSSFTVDTNGSDGSSVGSVGGSSVGSTGSTTLVTGDDQSNYVAPVHVHHTGVNTQQTYLPPNHK